MIRIEENGIDLLSYIDREKKRAKIADSKDMTITIEREGGFWNVNILCFDGYICKNVISIFENTPLPFFL